MFKSCIYILHCIFRMTFKQIKYPICLIFWKYFTECNSLCAPTSENIYPLSFLSYDILRNIICNISLVKHCRIVLGKLCRRCHITFAQSSTFSWWWWRWWRRRRWWWWWWEMPYSVCTRSSLLIFQPWCQIFLFCL